VGASVFFFLRGLRRTSLFPGPVPPWWVFVSSAAVPPCFPFFYPPLGKVKDFPLLAHFHGTFISFPPWPSFSENSHLPPSLLFRQSTFFPSYLKKFPARTPVAPHFARNDSPFSDCNIFFSSINPLQPPPLPPPPTPQHPTIFLGYAGKVCLLIRSSWDRWTPHLSFDCQ